MHATFVEFTDEKYELIKSYCILHGSSLSGTFKKVLLEKIEDEFDLAEYEAAKKRYDEKPISYSLDEVRNELNLNV